MFIGLELHLCCGYRNWCVAATASMVTTSTTITVSGCSDGNIFCVLHGMLENQPVMPACTTTTTGTTE